jgi:hypothetical protein
MQKRIAVAMFGAMVACNAVLGIPEADNAGPTTASSSSSGTVAKKACADGQKACGGSCVALNDPATGCGNQDCKPCPTQNATGSCTSGGQCAFTTCSAGFKDCNGQPADGCETAVSSDKANCGDCGNSCAGELSCSEGTCGCKTDQECQTNGGPGNCAMDTHLCHCGNDGECNPGVVCTANGECNQN